MCVCVFSGRDCDLYESAGEKKGGRREAGGGEASPVFHETFKPTLMRTLPLVCLCCT